jgi:AAA+ superfamily predicted ATPase
MKPYGDSFEHLRDEFARLDVALLSYVDTSGAMDGFEGGYEGGYVAEIEQLLRQRGDDWGDSGGPAHRRIDDLAEQIDARVAATDRSETPLRFFTLAENFDLSRRERDALLLALAPEIDQTYGTVFSYLRDDVTQKRPTVGLLSRVLSHVAGGQLDALTTFAGSEPLLSESLLRLYPDTPELPKPERSVYVDSHLVEFLLGRDDLDDALAEHAELTAAPVAVSDLTLEPETADRLDTLVEDARTRSGTADGAEKSDSSNPVVYYLHGPEGSGRSEAAAAIATALETPRLRVDASGLLAIEGLDVFRLLEREATLHDAALQIDSVDVLVPEDGRVDDVVARLRTFERDVFLTGREPWTPRRTLPTHSFASVHVARPSYALRKELWEAHTEELPESVETADIASKFELTPGQIEDALFTARATANGHGLTRAAVYRGCRAQSTGTLDAHAQKVAVTYGWNDIVLPEAKRARLREVAAHVKHRGTVYSDWGFDEKFSLGNGLSVLFSGPSGTGKTMAAEIIAGVADLDLYKVDIASVVSKYIGETEKNLGKIFDEAEHSDAVLLFDEADAIFGQRSEVSDAQDRYANVEVNYLLQRIEEHEGTVVLTTNLEQNIDDAFLRRLDVSVDFPRPDRQLRQQIWEGIFPDRTPLGEIDYEFLSSFDVTGGNIKNIAETAAFLAADDDGLVSMEHVVTATRLELQKIGKLVNTSDFGEYRELL